MAARVLKGKDPKNAKPAKPKIVIYGPPGVGKTWGALDFPSAYYIDTEGGANLDHYTDKLKKSGGLYLGVEDGSLDFDVVTDEIITLATTKHEFRTLIIDSYSKLFNTDISRCFEALDKKNPGVATFGAEKKHAINLTRRWVDWFTKMDMNVILICHEKTKYETINGNSQAVGKELDGWDRLEYDLNLCLHINKQGNSRKARVTKTRFDQFKDGEVFDWSYATFADKYGRDVIEANSVAVILATTEQIAEFTALLDTVKVDTAVIEKWNSAGPVEELTTADIQKRIDFLNKQLEKAKA
jgi:hypothetical protein